MEKRVTHIAIFVGDAIERILSGEKTVEGRFSISKIAPYGKVKKGDIILLKQTGAKIIGQVEVDNVLYFDQLDGQKIGRLRKEYSDEMKMNDNFWQDKQRSCYASIIFLKNPRKYLTPLNYHKSDRRAWLTM
jgi:predicted transcriptional regulator